MNTEIHEVVQNGLDRWLLIPNVEVSYLVNEAWPDLLVPKIVIPSRRGLVYRSPVVVGATDFHVEENTGNYVFSDPDFVYPIVQEYVDRYSFVFYPQVNHHAPAFMDALGRPKEGYTYKEAIQHARANEVAINYNDGWGTIYTSDQKTREGRLIEDDTNNLMKDFDVVLGITDHEDSTAPHQGYFWANEPPVVTCRAKIIRSVDRLWRGRLVTQFDTYRDTEIEWDRFCAVNVRDPGSWETYMNDQGIPTVLSEAPFGDSLEDRLFFHELVLAATLEVALK